MADESQYPYWGRLSGAVKNILIQARRWSVLAKKPRVYCDHSMTAQASSYPEDVKKEVPQLSIEKITLILKKSSVPPGSKISRLIQYSRHKMDKKLYHENIHQLPSR